jgi:hypothetical protein
MVEATFKSISPDCQATGLMVQILGGLITYLLMAIYCRQQFDENVSIKRVRKPEQPFSTNCMESIMQHLINKISKSIKKNHSKNLTGHY